MTMNLTLRVEHETQRPKYPSSYGSTEMVSKTEVLCDIKDQAFSTGMLAAALRQLADEVDPPRKVLPADPWAKPSSPERGQF